MNFIKPDILYFLLLIVIPVIIHLFNLQRHKKILFSDVYFLTKINEESKSVKKIKRFILLLTRILTLSAIIFAFAFPTKEKNSSNLKSDRIGIYIDNSFSMAIRDTDGTTLFNKAKNNAKKIIDSLDENQKIVLFTNELNSIKEKWVYKDRIDVIIDSISLSGNQCQLNNIFQKFSLSIDSTKNNELYIFSDFQKNIDLTENDKKYTFGSKFDLVQTDLNFSNISIDSCYFTAPIRTKNEIENLNIVLTNHGNEMSDTKVDLFINEQKKSSYSLEIPPNTKILSSLNFINPVKTNYVKGRIEIDDNTILFDNKLFFSYSTKQKIPILTIYDDTLSPYIPKSFSDSIFIFTKRKSDEINVSELEKNQLIIIDKLKIIPGSLVQNLKNYVIDGGSVFIFPNRNLVTESYNNLFRSLGIGNIGQWTNKKNNVKYINLKHKLFKGVFKNPSENINLPNVSGYFEFNKNKNSQNRKIFEFKNNDLFLSEHILGLGSIYLTLSDLNNSNFPEHSLFPLCLYNAALVNKRETLFQKIENQIVIKLHNKKENELIKIVKGNDFEIIGERLSRNNINFGNNIKEAGNYEVISDESTLKLISFNYDRGESKMSYFSESEIKSILKYQKIDFIANKKNIPSKKVTLSSSQNKISLFFIALAIFLLLIELILLRTWNI